MGGVDNVGSVGKERRYGRLTGGVNMRRLVYKVCRIRSAAAWAASVAAAWEAWPWQGRLSVFVGDLSVCLASAAHDGVGAPRSVWPP